MLVLLLGASLAVARPARATSPGSPGPIDAIFVFGDSLLDVGNNNYGPADWPKNNFAPYGINYIPASGRVCDGKLTVDYLAEWLGFPGSPPPYLQPGRNATLGQIFSCLLCIAASFKPRIIRSSIVLCDLPPTGTPRLPGIAAAAVTLPAFQASQQLQWYAKFQADVNAAAGADPLLPKSPAVFSSALHIVGLGANDYQILFFGERVNESTIPRLAAGGSQQARDFASAVVGAIEAYVRRLYGLGARRFLLSELPPFGCAPLWRQALQQAQCVAVLNGYAQAHNRLLAAAAGRLREELQGSQILLAKVYGIVETAVADPATVGLLEGSNACCGGPPPLNGLVQCGTTANLGGNMVTASQCSRPQDAVFWDQFHHTESLNRILARNLFVGRQDSISPMSEVLASASLLVEAASSAPRGDTQSGSSGPHSEVAVASALEVFQSRVDLFQAACDRAQQQVDAARHRLLSESLVDEARGAAIDTPAVGAAGGEGEAQMVLGATRLEQISKAVRAMVQDLQHGHTDKH
ncbi:unnamed protein product [Closterium sp. NIES-64]|nr:unnamed protein product [Closterium sp. NIES-64]